MENGSGLSASDVALLNGNRSGVFGGNGDEGLLYLFLIAMMFGGGFGGWNNNGFSNAIGYENLATSNEVQRGFDNQNNMANQRDILAAVNDASARGIAATNQSFHDMVGYVGDKYDELQRDTAALAVGQANILANQNNCCCESKMLMQQLGAEINANIAQSRYDAAMNTAAINATTIAQAQRILDENNARYVDYLRDQLNQRDMMINRQSTRSDIIEATTGVLRMPQAITYSAGPLPPLFGQPGPFPPQV